MKIGWVVLWRMKGRVSGERGEVWLREGMTGEGERNSL